MATKRKNTELRQQQILETAAKLILKYGSSHFTIKRIALMVGISEAAIYHHFKSKKSILSFLLIHIEEILIKNISTERASVGPVTISAIGEIIGDHFSAIDLRMGFSFHVITEIISIGDRELNKQASRTIDKYICRLRELLNNGVRDGAIRKDIDLDAAAILLFALIQGMVNMWAIGDCRFNISEKYKSLWNIYRDAIANR